MRADGQAAQTSERRWRAGWDALAGLLLVGALLLPWNLSFGVGVPGSSLWMFILLVAVTISSGATLVLTYAGGRGRRSAAPASGLSTRARLALNVPCLVTVCGFIAYALVQAFHFGGTGDVPPGIGPGALSGLAAALLAAQPPGDASARSDRWPAVARLIAVIAAVLVTAAVVANLYWRTRFPISAMFDGVYGGPNLAVIVTTVAYAAVAWLAGMLALRWSFHERRSSALATTALGAATIAAAVIVWVVGVGRDIDAFHGIAQTTSTTGVGFEAYAAWVAVAAIAAPRVLRTALTAPANREPWRDGTRMCLALIAVGSGGSAILRACDVIVAMSLGTPYSLFDSTAMLAFDAVAAAIAVWLRVNIRGTRLHPVVLSAGTAVLFVLMVCRVVVGVGLAPRILYSAEPEGLRDAVYGNMLVQQITSTFDVLLALLALSVAAIAVVVLQRGGLGGGVPVAKRPAEAPRPVERAAPVPVPAAVVVQTPDAATSVTHPVAVTPRIARSSEGPTRKIDVGGDRKSTVAGLLAESTQRFGAGTTYGGTGSHVERGSDGG